MCSSSARTRCFHGQGYAFVNATVCGCSAGHLLSLLCCSHACLIAGGASTGNLRTACILYRFVPL